MKEIELTRGYKTQVDDHMFDMLNQYKWHAHVMPYTVYARRNHNGAPIWMHNVILPPHDGMTADHKDGNGLNNLCDNLRLATSSQQQSNRRGWSATGVKGVYQARSRWYAQIGIGGKRERVGPFNTIEEAGAAYKAAALKLHGPFVRHEKEATDQGPAAL